LITERTFVTESELLSSEALRSVEVSGRALDQEADLGKPNLQELSAEPFLP
jgi:hypothetical protein